MTKAWTEMVHRYAAGTLALLIAWFAFLALRSSRDAKPLPLVLPLMLVALVIFQAALGMWTVTLKLLPVVVMGHLLGGMLIFACLCYWRWQLTPTPSASSKLTKGWLVAANVAVLIVFCQIALGGWVSSNYAGIACIGFPRCNGLWVPPLDVVKGFNVFSTLGPNYQGGVLSSPVRTTIHWVHRLGAIITLTYLLALAGSLWRFSKNKSIKLWALVVAGLVLWQFSLGILNVLLWLPLWVSVAHNGFAALLLGATVSLRYKIASGGGHVARLF